MGYLSRKKDFANLFFKNAPLIENILFIWLFEMYFNGNLIGENLQNNREVKVQRRFFKNKDYFSAV